jgi:mRNA interferase HicA
MKAGEFVRRVQRLAKKTQTPCRFVKSHGKGSHGTLYYGERRTTVQDRKRELPTGTFHAMLRQLGITTETFSEE